MPNEIQKIKNAVETQVKQTDEVIASNEAVADVISELNNTLSEVHGTVSSGFSMLGAGLQELCFSIDDGFRELSYKLDLQNETLEAIKEILERPLDTQAKELRKRAEFAYLNGWMDEAEVDLLESEKKNYQDFIALHILGNIYYHHKKNHQKALEYFQKAAKYAAPQSKLDACKALLCAAKVYKELGRVEDAYKSTRLVMDTFSDDAHNLFNHAAYSAMTRHTDESINCLRQAVLIDSTFLITADSDERFSNVAQEKEKLKRDLRDKQRQAVEQLREKLTVLRKDFEFASKVAQDLGITDFSQYIKDLDSLDAGIDEIDKLRSNNAYLDLLKAEKIAHALYTDGLKAYEENIDEWIKVKNIPLDKLKNDTPNAGEGWGLGAGIVTFFISVPVTPIIIDNILKPGNSLSGALFGLLSSLFGFFGVPIIVGLLVSYGIRQSNLNVIREKIVNIENAITRLSDLKKK